MKNKIVIALSGVFLLCVIALFGLSYYSKTEPQHVLLLSKPTIDMVYKKNIRYKKTSQNHCKLDVAYMEDSKKKPLIIFVHGGSWTGGSREEFRDLMFTFANEGYVATTIDYDLVTTDIKDTKDIITITDEIICVDKAVEYLVNNEDDYQIDKDHIFIAGHSSGGQLVGNLAERVASNPENYAYQFAGVILLAAASDFRSFLYNENVGQDDFSALALLSFVFDGNYDSDIITEINKVDVMTNITADLAPTLLIHGNMDDVLSYRESEKLYDAMKKAGCTVDITLLDNVGHGLDHQQLADVIKPFIEKNTQGAEE